MRHVRCDGAGFRPPQHLFEARLDPDRVDSTRGDGIVKEIEKALDSVTSLEEDSILRRLLNLIGCTLRTNYFQRDGKGAAKAYLKINGQWRDHLLFGIINELRA